MGKDRIEAFRRKISKGFVAEKDDVQVEIKYADSVIKKNKNQK